MKLVIDKATDDDLIGRFREIISDPANLLIHRHPLAGQISGDLVTLHNGLVVPIKGPSAYYGAFSMILAYNRGVHEPLEEYIFQQVLAALPSAPVMLELGAYWGHYSMWLKSLYPGATQYLVEPDIKNFEVGKSNFKLNNLEGEFIQQFVGHGKFEVDHFLTTRNITCLNILHADIQHYEMQMLMDASVALASHVIDYVFVSTHSADLHEQVHNCLAGQGYRIEVSSDFDNDTTSFDGLVFATSPLKPRLLNEFQAFSRSEIGILTPAGVLDRLQYAPTIPSV